ncbi:MAG: hypothetical protein ACKO23_00925, partial [Gemmataceae bacterium]
MSNNYYIGEAVRILALPGTATMPGSHEDCCGLEQAAASPGRPARPASRPSYLQITLQEGRGLTVSSFGQTSSDPEGLTRIVMSVPDPEHPIIIGRCSSLPIEYLEQGYEPTHLAPGSGRSILHYGDEDYLVSRAHFMLHPTHLEQLYRQGANVVECLKHLCNCRV